MYESIYIDAVGFTITIQAEFSSFRSAAKWICFHSPENSVFSIMSTAQTQLFQASATTTAFEGQSRRRSWEADENNWLALCNFVTNLCRGVMEVRLDLLMTRFGSSELILPFRSQ